MRDDWVNTELGKVCFTTSGGTPSRKVDEYYEGNIPWVKSGELNHNIVLDTEEHISEEAVKNSSAKIFPNGTLLIALYGATIGKLAILGIPATTNQAVCGIYENEVFETKFLFNYLFHKKQKLIEQGAGGAQPNISQTILKQLSVPLAPLPEQRAIVAKIEKLFSDLDNGIANLKAAKAKLDIYRQAVLKKAFEGELTKTSSASIDMEFANLGSLIEKPKYGTSKKCRPEPNGTPVLRIPNIEEGIISHDDLKYAQFDTKEAENLMLKEGDLLTIRSNGSVDLVGKSALIKKSDTHCLYAGYLIRLRPIPEKADSKFLLYCLSSHDLRVQIESKAKSTSGVNNINSGELESLRLPIFSLEEQTAIVAAIESRLSVCDKLAESIDQGLEKAEALRQSILKKAFAGQLLDEAELAACRREPDWEPAAKLLERIKKDKPGRSVKKQVNNKG